MKKILFICLLSITACVSNNDRNLQGDAPIPEPPYIVSLEKEIGNIKQAKLNEVGNTISYIQLETSNNCLLSDSLIVYACIFHTKNTMKQTIQLFLNRIHE